jgi:hypothetical protein
MTNNKAFRDLKINNSPKRTDRDMLIHILNEITKVHMADWNFNEAPNILINLLDKLESEITEHFELEGE